MDEFEADSENYESKLEFWRRHEKSETHDPRLQNTQFRISKSDTGPLLQSNRCISFSFRQAAGHEPTGEDIRLLHSHIRTRHREGLKAIVPVEINLLVAVYTTKERARAVLHRDTHTITTKNGEKKDLFIQICGAEANYESFVILVDYDVLATDGVLDVKRSLARTQDFDVDAIRHKIVAIDGISTGRVLLNFHASVLSGEKTKVSKRIQVGEEIRYCKREVKGSCILCDSKAHSGWDCSDYTLPEARDLVCMVEYDLLSEDGIEDVKRAVSEHMDYDLENIPHRLVTMDGVETGSVLLKLPHDRGFEALGAGLQVGDTARYFVIEDKTNCVLCRSALHSGWDCANYTHPDVVFTQ